jgi:hypothetical protein
MSPTQAEPGRKRCRWMIGVIAVAVIGLTVVSWLCFSRRRIDPAEIPIISAARKLKVGMEGSQAARLMGGWAILQVNEHEAGLRMYYGTPIPPEEDRIRLWLARNLGWSTYSYRSYPVNVLFDAQTRQVKTVSLRDEEVIAR